MISASSLSHSETTSATLRLSVKSLWNRRITQLILHIASMYCMCRGAEGGADIRFWDISRSSMHKGCATQKSCSSTQVDVSGRQSQSHMTSDQYRRRRYWHSRGDSLALDLSSLMPMCWLVRAAHDNRFVKRGNSPRCMKTPLRVTMVCTVRSWGLRRKSDWCRK